MDYKFWCVECSPTPLHWQGGWWYISLSITMDARERRWNEWDRVEVQAKKQVKVENTIVLTQSGDKVWPGLEECSGQPPVSGLLRQYRLAKSLPVLLLAMSDSHTFLSFMGYTLYI